MPVKGAEEFKSLKKKYAKGVELRGKTLGIIGFGRIGRSTAKYALGCGMKVIANDRNPVPSTLPIDFHNGQSIDVEIESASFEKVLSESDYISLHIPKQENGSAVITSTEIEKMKPGVRIVNAARGGVIDEDSILKALEAKHISYIALDVFENEPTPRVDLLENEKIAATPHIGTATTEAQTRIGLELAEQIVTLLK